MHVNDLMSSLKVPSSVVQMTFHMHSFFLRFIFIFMCVCISVEMYVREPEKFRKQVRFQEQELPLFVNHSTWMLAMRPLVLMTEQEGLLTAKSSTVITNPLSNTLTWSCHFPCSEQGWKLRQKRNQMIFLGTK